MVVYANPQDEGRIAWGVHFAGFSHSGNIVEGLRQPDGSDTAERPWWYEPGDEDRQPAEPLPTPSVEEVREWRKAEDSIIASGIIHYWTAEGPAQQAAFREAEERYKAEGLL